MIENFQVKEIKEVPEDVAENWVDSTLTTVPSKN